MKSWQTRVDSRPHKTSLGLFTLGLAAALVVVGFGCASDPASQKRIQSRNERVSRTIEGIQRSEARHPEKLDRFMKDVSRDQAQKEKQYRETMRTLGDRFW